jgi:lipoyl(octanoyl) transferase
VRSYARLLESTTAATLRRFDARLEGFTTDDPGVWVAQHSGDIAKIAALGVHLRRHVSALGVAINVDMPGSEDGDEIDNPWARFVPCGLEGKAVTSIAREVKSVVPTPEQVASVWAEEFARGIGADEVQNASPDEVEALLRAS